MSNAAPKPAGILRREDILEEIVNRRLIDGATPANVQACSYDMTIGTIFINKKKITPNDVSGVTLDPGAIISLFTREELNLPPDIAATAFAINAMSSEGLLVLNPGHIDPGFKGPLTVRAINLRATSKAINFGTRIFTVIFERLPQATAHPYSYNKTREERENDFHAKDVEQNPESLFRLVTLGKDKPLMTAEEVRNEIKRHWSTKLVSIAAVFAAIGGILAVVISLVREKPEKAPAPIIMTVPTSGQPTNSNMQIVIPINPAPPENAPATQNNENRNGR